MEYILLIGIVLGNVSSLSTAPCPPPHVVVVVLADFFRSVGRRSIG